MPSLTTDENPSPVHESVLAFPQAALRREFLAIIRKLDLETNTERPSPVHEGVSPSRRLPCATSASPT